jgi:predicted amidohydrolase
MGLIVVRLGLVSKEFRNNDIDFNMNQIIKTMMDYKDNGIDFLCFGEAFLQGFDAFNWKIEHDYKVALSRNSNLINKLKSVASNSHIGLAFGYLEREDSKLFSSYMFIDKSGKEIYNYRRYSSGWKEDIADERTYLEGKEIGMFNYNNKKIIVGLCGDFWDERYDYIKKVSEIKKEVVIWPVYVDFTLQEWDNEIKDYAKQANIIGDRVLMINSICNDPKSHGGCFDFYKGTIENKISFDTEDVMIINL